MERRDINIVLGIGKDGELYILDGIFHNSDSFQGVTCQSREYLTDDEIEKRNDFDNVMDYCDELWRMAVEARHIEDGLKEFTENYIWEERDKLYPGYDDSFVNDTEEAITKLSRKQKKELYEFYDIEDMDKEFNSDCAGCGRHFPEDNEWEIKFVSDELLDLLHRLDNTDEHVDWDRLNALIDKYDEEVF